MKKIAIIGATGSLAKVVRTEILEKTDFKLTLFARNSQRLGEIDKVREQIIAGNVSDQKKLREAIKGQDSVYINLSGDLENYVKRILIVMKEEQVKQVIFISSMGIYNELQGAKGSADDYPTMLAPYRKAADLVETSGLDYTIIRPGWFDDSDNLNYQLTEKNEPFIGHDISRKGIADLIIRIVTTLEFGKNKNFGIAR